METQPPSLEPNQPGLNALGQLVAQFLEYGNNAKHNISESVSNMTTQNWLRLTAIVGGYILLRPYIMKHAAKTAVKNMEDDDEREKAQITPNELRGVKQQIEVQDEEDEGADGSGADWGRRARVRQRVMLKQMLEAEERRREEEEDDEDIKEFLED